MANEPVRGAAVAMSKAAKAKCRCNPRHHAGTLVMHVPVPPTSDMGTGLQHRRFWTVCTRCGAEWVRIEGGANVRVASP